MSLYHVISPQGKDAQQEFHLSEKASQALQELALSTRDGLLALCVDVGMGVLQALMEEEIANVAGPKGKHDPERTAMRHGCQEGFVVLGARKIKIARPRARTIEGREIQLHTYQAFQDGDRLTAETLERMLHGLSSRNYRRGLEPCGERQEKGTSKSAVSRRFVAGTRSALAKLLTRELTDLDILVLFIDSVVLADHTVTVALGIDTGGNKHILGLAEGATENASVCKRLLSDLVERGFNADEGILAVLDGAKALRRAVSDVFGDKVAIQRCRVHKKRNVMDHLPKDEQARVAKKLDAAWREKDVKKAERKLEDLARSLEISYPGAAASLREGLAETLTVTRLGLPELLQTSLRSTNIIESAFDLVGGAVRNVKRWRHGEQVMRWAAAGLWKAEERFHRIKGYQELCLLRLALRNELGIQSKEAVPRRKSA